MPVSGAWGAGKASIWAEMLSANAKDAEVLLRDGPANGSLDDQPTVLSRPLGKGRITYFGALLDPALMQAAVQWMAESAGLRPVFGPVPDDVEVCRRGKVFILLNHTRQPRTVALPHPSRDLLAGTELRDSVTLPVHGVAVIEASPKLQ